MERKEQQRGQITVIIENASTASGCPVTARASIFVDIQGVDILPEQDELQVAIGYVRRAVGLDGRVEIELFSQDPSRVIPGFVVSIYGQKYTVAAVAQRPKGLIAVHFEGITDRDSADMLRGADVCVPESSIPPAPQDTYYHYQLIGLAVVNLSGRQIGTLSGIMETGANDVYVVTDETGSEILIPAVRDVIKEIDISNKIVKVDLPT
jgi:16S rRNA processing protein RimM